MDQEQMFEVFYSEYLRHEARKDARKAWGQARVTDELFATLMAALRLQNEFKYAGKETCFIPLPASWLRGERWTDEIPDHIEIPRSEHRFHHCDAICTERGCPLDPIRALRRGV